jgi:hypothetical protein
MSCRTELNFPSLLGGNCQQNKGKQDQSGSLWDLLAEVNPQECGWDPGYTGKKGKSHIYIAFSQIGDSSRNR